MSRILVVTAGSTDFAVVCRGSRAFLTLRQLDMKIIRVRVPGPSLSLSLSPRLDTCLCGRARVVDEKGGRRLGGTNDQALRSSLRAQARSMRLVLEHATARERAALRKMGAIGGRAPSCALLVVRSACRLLHAFGFRLLATELASAVDRACVLPRAAGTAAAAAAEYKSTEPADPRLKRDAVFCFEETPSH